MEQKLGGQYIYIHSHPYENNLNGFPIIKIGYTSNKKKTISRYYNKTLHGNIKSDFEWFEFQKNVRSKQLHSNLILNIEQIFHLSGWKKYKQVFKKLDNQDCGFERYEVITKYRDVVYALNKYFNDLKNIYDDISFTHYSNRNQSEAKNTKITIKNKSWNDAIEEIIENLPKTFTLQNIYQQKEKLLLLTCSNSKFSKSRIRSTLQKLRDKQKIDFLGNGQFKKIKSKMKVTTKISNISKQNKKHTRNKEKYTQWISFGLAKNGEIVNRVNNDENHQKYLKRGWIPLEEEKCGCWGIEGRKGRPWRVRFCNDKCKCKWCVYPYKNYGADLLINKQYTRKEVQKEIGISEKNISVGGNWGTGYVQHQAKSGPFYIFANILQKGRSGYHYHNYWSGDTLVWSGKTQTTLKQPQIKKFMDKNTVRHLFTRNNSNNPKYIYQGIVDIEAIDGEKPVRFMLKKSGFQKNFYTFWKKL